MYYVVAFSKRQEWVRVSPMFNSYGIAASVRHTLEEQEERAVEFVVEQNREGRKHPFYDMATGKYFE